MHSFFIPQPGPRPKWCHFLDNLVHEMENEKPNETYRQLQVLDEYPSSSPSACPISSARRICCGPTCTVTSWLPSVYDQARLIANPYIFEEEQAKRIKEKVDKERSSRIRGVKKVKVNQKLVDRILQKQGEQGQGG